MNAPSATAAPRISWHRCLALFLFVLLVALPQAAMLPLIDRDEPRFAEAAREMIQNGNFVVPTFNGVPRYDKPPLIYWCEVLAYKIFGQDALAARLPSLVATAATAVLLYTWGVKLGSSFIGIGAALFYSLCFQAMLQGRVATADALLIFFMTLTAFAGWMLVRPGPLRVAPAPCFIALALGVAGGFLAKGPEAWLPLVPIFWYGRGFRAGISCSILAGIALMLLWGVPAYTETHGDYLWRSWRAGIADRAFATDQGHGGPYVLLLPYYLLVFWLSALPWSPLLLLHARKLFGGWVPDLTDRYLLFHIAMLFAVFTLLATKLPHYTLPVFPLIALLVLRRWTGARLSPAVPIRLAGGIGILLALLTTAFVPTALSRGYNSSPAGELVRSAGIDLTPETPFALVDFKEPTVIWEMRRVCRPYARLLPEKNLAAFFDQAGPRAAILTTTLWNQLKISRPDLKTYQANGINAAKLKIQPPFYLPSPEPLDLTLVVKP